MISRHWKGTPKSGEADNYVNHLRKDTFPQLSRIDGFVRASILTRPVAQGTEFLVVTVWESMAAIDRFAGPTPDLAVVPEVVQAMMLEYDKTVTHYQVVQDFPDELPQQFYLGRDK